MKTKKPLLPPKVELLEPIEAIPLFGDARDLIHGMNDAVERVKKLNQIIQRVNQLCGRENERHRP